MGEDMNWQELADLLALYLRGEKTLCDCAEWIAGIDWSELDRPTKGAVGCLELLATEVLEGFRSESEFRAFVVTFMVPTRNKFYGDSSNITVYKEWGGETHDYHNRP